MTDTEIAFTSPTPGGKDSTVISHIARQIKPDILHIFANTTCEYPETIEHIMWEKNHNGMNLLIVTPHDKYNRPWNFKRVVTDEGYPLFSKVVANAIRTYRRAKHHEQSKTPLNIWKDDLKNIWSSRTKIYQINVARSLRNAD